MFTPSTCEIIGRCELIAMYARLFIYVFAVRYTVVTSWLVASLGRAIKVAVAVDGEWSRRVCGCSSHHKRRSLAEKPDHLVAECRVCCLPATSWPFTAILMTSHKPLHTHVDMHTNTRTHAHARVCVQVLS